MTARSNFVTRFAPSPTGFLHLGHAHSALCAFRAAQAAGGSLLLRIEDIDAERCRPEFEAAIKDDIAFLGISYETPVRRQSEHLAEYAAALARLIDTGLAYRCFRTRAEILAEVARAPHLGPQGPDGPAFVSEPLGDAEERSLLAAGAPFAWRLSMRAARDSLGARYESLDIVEENPDGSGQRRIAADPAMFGDVVLGRKGNGASYHLASVHDDAMAGVTHVIRGEDLAPTAHLHALLQALFDWTAPVYRHHRLLTDESGRRLAKRDKAATLRALREAGAGAAQIRALAGFPD